MSKRNYRKYTDEFKQEALALLKKGNKNSAQLEEELGITKGLLLKWRDKYQLKQTGTSTKLELNDLETAKKEVLRLKRELAEVEEERDILKKAVSIFSRKRR
jgi:transposase